MRSTNASNSADALFQTFQQFETLQNDFQKARNEWLHEAGVGVLSTLRHAEAIERDLSGKLKQFDGVLVSFSAQSETEINNIDNVVEARRTRSTNVSLSAGIQMEILRLVEMKVLLPEKMWHTETGVLEKLDEFLIRSHHDPNINDYVALQQASLEILGRVFECILSNNVI
ncbi:hypothetical protein C8J55DRAFT_563751 [Lentinula edodes]|uniref:Uncharacterized protein n=1 Tax=Lentinula lateritia TaxID=40482 RepID=A0A9W8ZZM5_9AGAR|nr:hypothetical protein C8J55DRAFT_563751 [Lentinula edodes]